MTECTRCHRQIPDTATSCPHCGARVTKPKGERPPKWHERTSVTLCVAAGLVVVGLGFVHIITGVTSAYGLPFDIVRKEGFGYRETFVRAQRIQALPYTVARRKYPRSVAALQKRGYMPSGHAYEARMMGKQRESVQSWEAEFMRALGRQEPRWQDQLQGPAQDAQIDPQGADACNHRGITLARRGDYAAALAEFGRAIERDPTLASAFYNRALVHIVIGNLGPAASDFGAVVAIRPDFIEGYLRRGRLYAAINEHDKAIADFTKALELTPDCAEAYFRRALAYHARGEYDEAWQDVQKVRSLGRPVPSGFLQALRGTAEGLSASRSP